MKKIVIISLIVLTTLTVINNKGNIVKIPKEAIRIRVLANSNSEYDQNIKNEVKNIISKQLYADLFKSKNINEARKIINNNILNIEKSIDHFFTEKKYAEEYKVIYGLNYFPNKIYKDVQYDEGYYESLLVTIGDGEGDNWWCVLFPPLCLLEAESSNEEEVEYRFFVQELLDKYF